MGTWTAKSWLADTGLAKYFTFTKILIIEIANYIVSDPKIMMGKPVIKGTRITVESILEKLAAGESFEDLLKAHPHISLDSIHAALAFAADNLKADTIYSIAI